MRSAANSARVLDLLLLLGLAAAGPVVLADDDLEKLLEIGDEKFEPITRPLRDPPFLHRKSIRVTPQSLSDGWVENAQCHAQFAKMPSLQIVFNPATTRAIEITEARGIGRAWVEGATVQLEQVGPDSRLCFRSNNRVLTAGSGRYELKIGPFYYRYLDGYFPMQLELDIDYRDSNLRLLDISPDSGAGISIAKMPRGVRFESLFQGTLWVILTFALKNGS